MPVLNYRFSFGPWNIHGGADPFGPAVRPSLEFANKLKLYKQLGFDGVQFHDDDAVPDLEDLKPADIVRKASEVKKMLDDEGLVAEFVAPRLWEHPNGIDGGYTSNNPECRKWALERTLRAVDIAQALGTRMLVLLAKHARAPISARPRTPSRPTTNLVEAMNRVLEYDREITIAIEPKPNEPMDHAYVPTIGHALALATRTVDPSRVGGLIETAHALLAGLDPSEKWPLPCPWANSGACT